MEADPELLQDLVHGITEARLNNGADKNAPQGSEYSKFEDASLSAMQEIEEEDLKVKREKLKEAEQAAERDYAKQNHRLLAEREQDEYEAAKKERVRVEIRNEILDAFNKPVPYEDLVKINTPEGMRQRYGTEQREASWAWGRFSPQTIHQELMDQLIGPKGETKPKPYNSKEFQERYVALAVGAAGEITSGMLELSECDTVHVSPGVAMDKFVKLDPIFALGGPIKEDILSMNLARINYERAGLDTYSGSDREQREAILGVAYNKLTDDKINVMPDAFVIARPDKHAKLHDFIGVVEDKLYTAFEVDAWVTKMEQEFASTHTLVRDFRMAITPEDLVAARARLVEEYPQRKEELEAVPIASSKMKNFGINLGAELTFLDMMRLSREMPEIGKDGIVVLRFGSDIPPELLGRLGVLCDAMEYKVIIQQIPFSREEIKDIGILKAAQALETALASGNSGDYSVEQINDVRELANKARKATQV